MIPLPKPRGFWDYTLFALIVTGVLVFLFWVDASDGIGWADAVLALAAAVLFSLAVIVARRQEKARWIAHPTWPVHLAATLGAFILLIGTMYADAYLLHRRHITSERLRRDMLIAIVVTVTTLWTSRRRSHAERQLL
jgi:drug/metabolite transporter (DMT)-like permease